MYVCSFFLLLSRLTLNTISEGGEEGGGELLFSKLMHVNVYKQYSRNNS